MSYMFNECHSLASLPDISKWNTNKVIKHENFFKCCFNLSNLPNIFK